MDLATSGVLLFSTGSVLVTWQGLTFIKLRTPEGTLLPLNPGSTCNIFPGVSNNFVAREMEIRRRKKEDEKASTEERIRKMKVGDCSLPLVPSLPTFFSS